MGILTFPNSSPISTELKISPDPTYFLRPDLGPNHIHYDSHTSPFSPRTNFEDAFPYEFSRSIPERSAER